jgi:hypothetical protein
VKTPGLRRWQALDLPESGTDRQEQALLGLLALSNILHHHGSSVPASHRKRVAANCWGMSWQRHGWLTATFCWGTGSTPAYCRPAGPSRFIKLLLSCQKFIRWRYGACQRTWSSLLNNSSPGSPTDGTTRAARGLPASSVKRSMVP